MSILKVGAAKANITPSKRILPIPFFMMFEMDEAIDPLHVRILDIESDERVLFATFDMTFVPSPDETMAYIKSLTGLDEDHIFLAATHTHCTPIVGAIPGAEVLGKTSDDKNKKIADWYTEIKAGIKEAIEQAVKNKCPASMGFGTGKSYVNINRDEVNDDGKAIIGVNFERESDKTLCVIKFESLEGKPIAYLVNYAVHATVMNGCIIGNKIKITADLPGVACGIVEKMHDGVVCVWTSGAAGDQNPRFGTQFPTECKSFTDIKNLGETGHYVLEYLAKEHARDIEKTIRTIRCTLSDVKISAQKTSATCKGRTPDGVAMLYKMQGKEIPPAPDMEYILRLVTIGDIAVQGISAEVVTSIGKAVRAVSPYEKTILITQTDTYKGYCPDDWEYEHNAFEAEGTQVQKGEAQREFVNGFNRLLGK